MPELYIEKVGSIINVMQQGIIRRLKAIDFGEALNWINWLLALNIYRKAENLITIRDFIRFGVSALRQYDAHLGQGTEDFFAESSALVLQTLALDWNANPEILDAKLLPSEKTEFINLLERRINEKVPTSYLLNLAYFCDKPYYVDERVLIPRSPIAELIQNRFAPYFLDENRQSREGVNNLPKNPNPQMPRRILDMCTGSGCIAIALSYAFPESNRYNWYF